MRVFLGRDPVTGHVKHLSKTVHGSGGDADEVLHDLIAKYGGGWADGVGATFGQLLDVWLDECERLDRSPTTVRNYRVQVDKTIRPALGKVKVSWLSARQLDELYGVMKDQGASPKTIRNYHATISSALHQAVRWGWVRTRTQELICRFVSAHERQPTAVEAMQLRQQATLDTRPRKAHRSLAERTVDWRHRSEPYLGDEAAQLAWVAGLAGRNDLPVLHAIDLGELILADAARAARDAVSSRRSTFTRHNIQAEALRILHDVRFASPDERVAVAEHITTVALEGSLASLALRAGQADAIDTYHTRGRITGGDRDRLLDALYHAWKADVDAGRASLMIATDTATIAELNRRARAERMAAGAVNEVGVQVTDGQTAGVGDLMVTRHNDRRLSAEGRWVKNGHRCVVTATHDDRRISARRADGAGEVLPASYVAEHVELAYATTSYQAEGRTVDTAHAFVSPTTTREVLYVSTTRGRESNQLYVDTRYAPDPATGHDSMTPTQRPSQSPHQRPRQRGCRSLRARDTTPTASQRGRRLE